MVSMDDGEATLEEAMARWLVSTALSAFRLFSISFSEGDGWLHNQEPVLFSFIKCFMLQLCLTLSIATLRIANHNRL